MKKLYILPILFGMLFSSCEDYLNVGSDTELTQEQIYSTDEGFHKALTGVYIGLTSESLYGSQLTWRMIEHFAHHYYVPGTGMSDYYFAQHDYTHSTVAPAIRSVWNGMYNLIGRCNDILQNLEERKDEVHPLNYQMVRGEALALRAFLHFDLLRLFGYGDYRNRSAELQNKYTIPYVTTFGKEITEQATYAEVFTNLKKDLNEAAKLLWGENGENCKFTYNDADKLSEHFALAEGSNANFYTYMDYDTKPRLNYYGVKAILARVLMWEGTDEGYQEILDFLEQEWIPAADDNGYDCWDWISSSRLTGTYTDRLMTQENIWQLSVSGLYDKIGQWFTYRSTDTNNYFRLTNAVYQEIYEYNAGNNSGLADQRAVRLYTNSNSGSGWYAILKLDQYEGENNYSYKNIIPLISTPELYYMAAEIYNERGEYANALAKLNEVRQHRGIMTNLTELDYEFIKTEIMKEWRKEYIALGQIFYFYKRCGIEKAMSTDMNDKKYVLPFPEDEIVTGNREQFIIKE